MKTKILFVLLAGGVLALAAWLTRQASPVQADEIPEKYRETLDKGLAYLAKCQSKDGHWEGDGGKHPVAMTGLVGLAFFMEKDIPTSGRGLRKQPVSEEKYSANVRKAVDWLMDKSKAGRDGLIFSEHPSETARYMQGHGLATLFLAGACAYERNDERRQKLNYVLTGAVRYIAKARSAQGGWYDTSKVEGHDFDSIAATVIQIQALQAAENAGIPVPGELIIDAQAYLQKALGKKEADKKELPRSRQADVAGTLACWFNTNRRDAKDEWSAKLLKVCQTEIPMGRNAKFGRDDLAHYYYGQVVFNMGGNPWPEYRAQMFDHLQNSQNKDGSWPTANGLSVGPIYSTALWCTVLQLDKRSHPSRRAEQVAIF